MTAACAPHIRFRDKYNVMKEWVEKAVKKK